jgi:hypothetical protein
VPAAEESCDIPDVAMPDARDLPGSDVDPNRPAHRPDV